MKHKKNLRIIDASDFSINENFKLNSINDSILIQSEDKKIFTKKDFKVVSKIKPNKDQLNNLIFAFNVSRYVKSNAIVLAANKTTVGIGSGQPSRLDSCEIAIRKMKKFNNLKEDIVAASDAFFPFADGVEALIKAGVKVIIQPGGSVRDREVIDAADKAKVKMIFTGIRHFNH